jgi:hypothetical protein
VLTTQLSPRSGVFINTLEKDSFAATVVEVYTSTAENDRGLSDIVVQLTRHNLRNLKTSSLSSPHRNYNRLGWLRSGR